MEKQVFDLIFKEDEMSWQSILMDLVKQQGMDPWNIDISNLANSYVKKIKQLKELNLRISGKVILASALLLKVKSKLLIGDEMAKLDSLFRKSQEDPVYIADFDENIDLLEPMLEQALSGENSGLTPRTPQPRKRKVSIFDLVDALDKAMKLRKRRIEREIPRSHKKIIMPSGVDISEVIVNVYSDIKDHYKDKNKSKDKLTFSKLIPADDKETKVFTFIPLLHLYNQRRVDLDKKKHFVDIEIHLLKKGQRVSG